MKLTTIFTLLLCQRAQTIETLDLRYITVNEEEVHIAFPSALKYTRPGKHLQPVTLYKYEREPKLCPVKLITDYISKTSAVRQNQRKLLLSFTKPHKAATIRTISRWLKIVLKNAKTNVNIYQGHSLRTASSSKASMQGLNIQSVLKAGGWSRESTFAKFYKKEITVDSSVQFALL